MEKKNAEQGFLKKLFGKKSNCCSFQIEEIQYETPEGVESRPDASGPKCCFASSIDKDKT